MQLIGTPAHTMPSGASSMYELRSLKDGSAGADPQQAKRDMRLAEVIMAVLEHHYPGYPWGVVGEDTQGVAMIHISTLSKYCWVLHTRHLTNVYDFQRKIVNAGGSYLERFGLRRGPCDLDAYLEVLSKITPESKSLNPDDM